MQVNCTHFIGIPIFLFLFTLLYNPFGMDVFLAGSAGHYTRNLILMTVIVLGVLSISRMLMFILRRVLDFNWGSYVLWCLMEVVFSGMFLSILLGIGWAGEIPYLKVMSKCIWYLAAITIYPYLIINLLVQLIVTSRLASAPAVDDKALVRFYDDSKRLKLIVAANAILYVQAEENYVHIIHVDNDKVKDFNLRSSMRALEDNLAKHGLVRCHRSYFINPEHVELLKKDPAGYAVAQLRRDGMQPIPVSKRYYDALTKLL